MPLTEVDSPSLNQGEDGGEVPLHRLTFLRPQKPRDFRAHPRPQTPQALSLLPQKLCDLGHIFGHILLPFFLSILWAFAFLLVRLLLYLGVMDCVRPGVATFFHRL